MTTYQVSLTAHVTAEIEIEADSEEEAEHLAYESIDDMDYEVDFVVTGVYEAPSA